MPNHIAPNRVGPAQLGSGTARREGVTDPNVGGASPAVRLQPLAGVITPKRPDLSGVGAGGRAIAALAGIGADLAFEEAQKQAEADFVEGQSLIRSGATLQELEDQGVSIKTLAGARALVSANRVRKFEAEATAAIPAAASQDPGTFAKSQADSYKAIIAEMPNLSGTARTNFVKNFGDAVDRVAAKQTVANQEFIQNENILAYGQTLVSSANSGDVADTMMLLASAADGAEALGLSRTQTTQITLEAVQSTLLSDQPALFDAISGAAQELDLSIPEFMGFTPKQTAAFVQSHRSFTDRQRGKFNAQVMEGRSAVVAEIRQSRTPIAFEDIYAKLSQISKDTGVPVENVLSPGEVSSMIDAANARIAKLAEDITPDQSEKLALWNNQAYVDATRGQHVTLDRVISGLEASIGPLDNPAKLKMSRDLFQTLNDTARRALLKTAKDARASISPGMNLELAELQETALLTIDENLGDPGFYLTDGFAETYLANVQEVFDKHDRPFSKDAERTLINSLVAGRATTRNSIERAEKARATKQSEVKEFAAMVGSGQGGRLSKKQQAEGTEFLIQGFQEQAKAAGAGEVETAAFVQTQLIELWNISGGQNAYITDRLNARAQPSQMVDKDGNATDAGVEIASLMETMNLKNPELANTMMKSGAGSDVYHLLKTNGFDINIAANEIFRASKSLVTPEQASVLVREPDMEEAMLDAIGDQSFDVTEFDVLIGDSSFGDYRTLSDRVVEGATAFWKTTGPNMVRQEAARLLRTGNALLATNPETLMSMALANVNERVDYIGIKPVVRVRGTPSLISQMGLVNPGVKGAGHIATRDYLANLPEIARASGGLGLDIVDQLTRVLPFIQADAEFESAVTKFFDGVGDFAMWDAGDGRVFIQVTNDEVAGGTLKFTLDLSDIGAFQRAKFEGARNERLQSEAPAFTFGEADLTP